MLRSDNEIGLKMDSNLFFFRPNTMHYNSFEIYYNGGSFSFPPPPPTSLKREFYGLTSDFTRLIMKTNYICHGLVSLLVNFHDNLTK